MKLRSLIAPLVATFLVPSTTLAQWSWTYPHPQGHTLHDIVFLDDTTAIAVGEAGTVLITHDSGQNWIVTTKVNGLANVLTKIESLNATTAVAVGAGGAIIRTDDQGEHWASIASGVSVELLGVSFADDLHGIAVGGNKALRTTDGGISWQSADTFPQLRAVSMTGPTMAVAVGDWGYVATTTDGGATWTTTDPLFTDAPLTAVDFLDEMNGAAAAASDDATPTVWYITNDGGANWHPYYPFGFDLEDLAYVPREIEYIALDLILVAYTEACCVFTALDPPPASELVVTKTAGTSWEYRRFKLDVGGIATNAGNVTLIAGQNGLLRKRTADGAYVSLGGGPSVVMGGSASSFADASNGVVMSSDDIFFGSASTNFARTTDGGETWVTSGFSLVECFDVTHVSSSEVYAVGQYANAVEGALLRSTNGGASWSLAWRGSAASRLNALATASPTHCVAVGDKGLALVIDNGVVTPVPTGATTYFNDVAFADAMVVVATGSDGTMIRSTNGGLTWAPIAGPTPVLVALDFATPTAAFGIGYTGIHRSDDAGSTWLPVPSGTFSQLVSIDFADAMHGMAVGSRVIATQDGGTTWDVIDQPTTRPLTNVTMIENHLAYVSGGQQILFKYGETTVPTLIRTLQVTASQFGAHLLWEVVSDEHLAGFVILRSNGEEKRRIADGISTSTRSYRDDRLVPGETYEYQLIAVDRDGSYTQSMPVSVTIPKATLELLPNQPNPFNPETTIRFVVPEKMPVQLTIHDVAGRVVATLVNDTRDPGNHTVTWKAEGLASGVYFARLRAGKTEVSQKMVLLK